MSRRDITPYVNQYIDGKMGVNLDRLIDLTAQNVVLDDVSLEEMRRAFLKQQIVPNINSKDFYSVCRGSKKYISLKCKNPAILKRMLENRNDDMDSSQGAYVKIQSAFVTAKNGCEHQITLFGGVEMDDGTRVEPNEAEIMEMVDELIRTSEAAT